MRKGLFPAGRLDKDTTGMMIITDDGEFAHNILAPRKHIEKTYHQIKRMFGCFGAKVVRLHRISMGGLQLPSDLEEGQCRELTKEELEKVCIRDK